MDLKAPPPPPPRATLQSEEAHVTAMMTVNTKRDGSRE
jgi:hypothetical protein